jgi:hypothetical protein
MKKVKRERDLRELNTTSNCSSTGKRERLGHKKYTKTYG